MWYWIISKCLFSISAMLPVDLKFSDYHSLTLTLLHTTVIGTPKFAVRTPSRRGIYGAASFSSSSSPSSSWVLTFTLLNLRLALTLLTLMRLIVLFFSLSLGLRKDEYSSWALLSDRPAVLEAVWGRTPPPLDAPLQASFSYLQEISKGVNNPGPE